MPLVLRWGTPGGAGSRKSAGCGGLGCRKRGDARPTNSSRKGAKQWPSPGKLSVVGAWCAEKPASEMTAQTHHPGPSAGTSPEGRMLGKLPQIGVTCCWLLGIAEKKSHTLQEPNKLNMADQAEKPRPLLLTALNTRPPGNGERFAEFSPDIAEHGRKSESGAER